MFFGHRNEFYFMSEPAVYFHLGFPKAASKLLQRKIFPLLKGIQFYKKRRFDDYPSIIGEAYNQPLLFSSEMDKQLIRYLKEILSVAPKAKIILVLREPSSWITSRYKYHIRKHGNLDFKEFIDIHNDTGFWKVEDLRFSKLLDQITELCSQKPLFLSYHLLRENPQKFINIILEYTNTQLPNDTDVTTPLVNKAFNTRQLKILKRFNRFYKYSPAETSSKALNKVHYKYREFLLHAVAFLARLVPGSLVGKTALIDLDYLEELREFYREDWERCESHLLTL